MTARWLLVFSALTLTAGALRADGPADNRADQVRPVPPPGVAIPAADRQQLQAGVEALGKEIDELRTALKDKPAPLDLLPDVQIYYNAVHYALKYNEFYNVKQVGTAKAFLKEGRERAKDLREGKAPWTTSPGLYARGYVSKIDGSVQPYGLVVPATFQASSPDKHRLDLWCHGRDETLTELSFINSCVKSKAEFMPAGAFVLRLYGRYCCANKFAGEIDALEAMHHVEKHYPIDHNRVVIRGFSMGGAACWQFAVHYPSLWAAAAPGAGFADTAVFLKVYQNETVKPTWWEQKLYHMYDSVDYAGNLFNCPTVAYSGENDSQRQAAEMMVAAAKREGVTIPHLLGPHTKHAYEPQIKKVLAHEIDAIVAKGRDETPAEVRFTTYTLRYNHDAWVRVDGLEKHWERAQINASLGKLAVDTKNVSAFTLSLPPRKGFSPAPLKTGIGTLSVPVITIDGTKIGGLPVDSKLAWTAHFRKENGKWQQVKSVNDGQLRKRHGLQGPIDDAFMESFLMVKPTGKPLNEKVGAWAETEMNHAIHAWRKQFRGEAPIKADDAITDADIADHNLVLWGDPSSNKVLARIADKLPIRWDGAKIIVGKETYSAGDHVPVLVYPNPLNPKRYVVLNSCFTFREYDYLNNARQVSKLPDYAVIDVRTPPSPRWPGKIVTAGFFNENWQLQPDGGK